MEGDMFGPDETPEDVNVEEVAQEPEEPEQPEAETPMEVPEPKVEPGFVPLAAVLDERDRRKQLERELEQYRQTQQPEPIDPWTDLEGALAQRDQQYQALLFQQKAQMSRRFAEMQHGAETVEQAVKWAFDLCESDPSFNARVYSSDDPVGFAVAQFQREQIASNMSMDDFKAFQAWKQAQSNPQPIAAPQAQPAPSAVPIPKSLATAQSAGAPSQPKRDPNEEKLASMF